MENYKIQQLNLVKQIVRDVKLTKLFGPCHKLSILRGSRN